MPRISPNSGQTARASLNPWRMPSETRSCTTGRPPSISRTTTSTPRTAPFGHWTPNLSKSSHGTRSCNPSASVRISGRKSLSTRPMQSSRRSGLCASKSTGRSGLEGVEHETVVQAPVPTVAEALALRYCNNGRLNETVGGYLSYSDWSTWRH